LKQRGFAQKNQAHHMAVIASAELIADLERTVRACAARSTLMLRRVADLLEVTADRPIEEAG
jgi:hypothetical protein